MGKKTAFQEYAWKAFTALFASAFVLSLIFRPAAAPLPASVNATAGYLNPQEASLKAEDYINALLQGQGTASVRNVTDTGSVYLLTLDVGGKIFESYITKDGKLLFPTAYDLGQKIEAPAQPSAPSAAKSARPSVELFVMSFCPYGIQAENAMKPVAELLGSKADIRIRYITQITGSTLDSVQSLHGPNEAAEDARQACVAKNYDATALWKYVSYVDGQCSAIYRDSSALESCWKSGALSAGINASKIEQCVASEGVSLLAQDGQKANAYGVSGSPTLIINGALYNGKRTSEAFKNAICGAFTEAPAECSQALGNGTGAVAEAPHAGCGG